MSEVNEVLIEEIILPESPLAAFESLSLGGSGFLLESALVEGRLGQWSFLGVEPFLTFSAVGKKILLRQNGRDESSEGNPFTALSSLLQKYQLAKPSPAPPFIGGAVGFFGYDLGQVLEKLPSIAVNDLNFPDCFLGFYDVIVAIDHLEQRAFICSSGLAESDLARRKARAAEKLAQTKERLLAETSSSPAPPPAEMPSLISNFTRPEYIEAIARTKEYIAAGDIYQVNLSQRFSCELQVSPLELYRRLRAFNPAPFAGLLLEEDWALVSASPERFLQVRGDWVETRPIKGTRPRGATPEEDARLGEELLVSEKDRAENVMIVDLERNDLGKVCDYGTVKTTELWTLEKYPTVFHLVSTVEGRLSAGKTSVDLLKASFPGGSITGAPKVRAMEIIEELEPTKRGPYTGAMGYLCFSGDMDTNIIIRSFVIKDGKAYFQVGGGIVADSDPAAEYQETLDKGRALVWAIAGKKEEF
jgi:para-aminobenzoate synthetase component 1